jgi:alpha,alpha-trehalase
MLWFHHHRISVINFKKIQKHKVGRSTAPWVRRLTLLCIHVARRGTLLIILYFLHAPVDGQEQEPKSLIRVAVQENLVRLISEEDTDSDKKITIDDERVQGGIRGDKRFALMGIDGRVYEVMGTAFLSNLLQELKQAEDAGQDVASLDFRRIFENPVRRISRLIRDVYWDGLTRQIDGDHLNAVLKDEKMSIDGVPFLYVPYSDPFALDYFSALSGASSDGRFRVVRLPRVVTPAYVKSLDGRHGLLSLGLTVDDRGRVVGLPYVVPGGRFNEMYGWDSYFIVLGLLADGRFDLARSMVDNLVYQIVHYGKVLNANRSYYLTRSQPPFLTSMALAVYESLPKTSQSKDWMKEVIRAAIREYHAVWMNADHLTETGLSRYFGSGTGLPPEVEPGHFDAIYRPYAQARGMDIRQFERLYKQGEIEVPALDRFFVNDRAVRESGHDTTYRWHVDGDRCADFVTVDLNSLLYKTEIDIARVLEEEFGDSLILDNGQVESSQEWRRRADRRKALIRRYLWDASHGLFFDYDVIHQKQHVYVSATTFYPLWACHSEHPETRLISTQDAQRLVQGALTRLEMAGGIAASDEASRGPVSASRPERQWDYPYGWAPHQMLAWRGLLNYGFDDLAHRLIYRWLYTIARNAADYNGTIPEKFDVVRRSHEVFAEYGNVGTRFSYMTKEGFGWMNASFQVGLALLPDTYRAYIQRLIPPEWLFNSRLNDQRKYE